MQVVVLGITFGILDADDIGDGILGFAFIEEASDTLVMYVDIETDIAIEATAGLGNNRRSKLGVVD